MVHKKFLYLCAKGFGQIHIFGWVLGSKACSKILWLFNRLKRKKEQTQHTGQNSAQGTDLKRAGPARRSPHARAVVKLAGGTRMAARERARAGATLTPRWRHRRRGGHRRAQIERTRTRLGKPSTRTHSPLHGLPTTGGAASRKPPEHRRRRAVRRRRSIDGDHATRSETEREKGRGRKLSLLWTKWRRWRGRGKLEAAGIATATVGRQ